MGDYSRDTYKLTNVMHRLLTGTSVVNARHYIGVRMQQGVPVLDADLNELDDIRNNEVKTLLRYFIGNGVPANNMGFEISGSGAANDFTINTGLIMVEGHIVINPGVMTYLTQPEAATLPALTMPNGGVDRFDLVYLDVWEQETGAEDTVNADERIVNPHIGIETARRLERRWAVCVAQNVQALADVNYEPNHSYAALALLQRMSGVAAINDAMVIDQRRLGITLAENLKIPLYVRRGSETVDSTRFAQMLNGLRTTLFDRLVNNTLPFSAAAPNAQRKETLILMSLQELMHLCQVGEVQVVSGMMDNADALAFLWRLYDAQGSWLDLVEDIGNDGGVATTFIADYRAYLNGQGAILGLYFALNKSDLLFAVLAQEELNAWLSAISDNLPEGSVDALYLTVLPYENLTAGQEYSFTYDIAANFISPQANEDFQVLINMNSGFGTAVPSQTQFTFSPPEANASLTVKVTPSGSLATANLDVIIRSVRNPLLRSTQLPITLTLNQLPPVAEFYFYAGERFNLNGQLVIAQNLISQVLGYYVMFKLRNTSNSESHTYQVTAHVIPNVANTAGWTPLNETPVSGSPFTVVANGEDDVLVNIRANGAGNIPPVGTTGQIISIATVDGSSDTVTVTIPFVIGAAV
ncbi:MAG: DUF6519 domain-containing protein [Methylobacter sp.]|jgi:hypothetical protein